MQPLNALVHQWTARSGLRQRALSWSWFETAFRAVIEAQPAQPMACSVDSQALSRAFFAWAEAVDSHVVYETLDELDFRHFISGLLLQKLLAAQPPVAACASAHARGRVITRFVLTLLQSLRLDMGAQPFVPDPASASEAWMSSYLENTHEDSSIAICFLDQMTGLEPVWRGPTLIESRPAVKKALARA
ncbi:MAG: hypothetical protein EOO28_18280 [Comamonadaceae bacterium]|nr:MAG: hypothetical protein EOO28_18280 [Comamonadaceae bacterium]